MNWTKNLITYCDSGKTGKCPKCDSEMVEVTEHIHGARKSLTFLCKVCKSSDHFDGVATKGVKGTV